MPKETPVRDNFAFFFYFDADEEEKTSLELSLANIFPLRGREGKDNCLDFDFGWIEDRSSSTEFGKNLILIGARSTKTEFKAGRGVQENTRQYRETKEANVIFLVLLTNI